MISFALSLVLITGCGRKTAPVYTEKDEAKVGFFVGWGFIPHKYNSAIS